MYHGGKILSDGVIPKDVINTSSHFRKEMIGFDVPKDIFVHVCGTDLIRDEKGKYLVLEDNALSIRSLLSARKQGDHEKKLSRELIRQ